MLVINGFERLLDEVEALLLHHDLHAVVGEDPPDLGLYVVLGTPVSRLLFGTPEFEINRIQIRAAWLKGLLSVARRSVAVATCTM